MKKTTVLIGGVLVISLVLRLIILNQSLWLDEAINVLAAKNLPFWHFVTGYPLGDFHPPGYFALLWIWSHLFGFSEVSVRIPSVLVGVLTVFMTYLLGQELINKKVGLMAAILLALNPLHIYYSQEARMYAMSALAVTLSAYFLVRLVKEQKWALIGLSLSTAFVFYSDYLPYLFIPCELLFLTIFFRDKISLFLRSMVLPVILLIPWLTVFPNQLSSGKSLSIEVPGWEKVVGRADIKNLLLAYIKAVLGRVSLANKYLYAAIVVPLGGLYLWILTLKRSLDWKDGLLYIWVFVPTILAFIVSIFVPVLSYFRMIYIIPGFSLLLAKNLEGRLKIYLLILVVSLICTVGYYLNPSFQRENWQGLVRYFDQSADSKTEVILENDNLLAPFQYYYDGRFSADGGIKNFPANSASDIKDLSALTKNKDRVYLVDYLVEVSDPNRLVDKQLTSLGFKVIAVKDFPTLGFIYEYSK